MEIISNVGTAIARTNPRTIAVNVPDVMQVDHQGKVLYLGKIHYTTHYYLTNYFYTPKGFYPSKLKLIPFRKTLVFTPNLLLGNLERNDDLEKLKKLQATTQSLNAGRLEEKLGTQYILYHIEEVLEPVIEKQGSHTGKQIQSQIITQKSMDTMKKS